MTLKVEAGKYYRTRDGRKVGPMVEETPRWSEWPWDVENGEGNLWRMLWKDDGLADETEHADLIAEWRDDDEREVDAVIWLGRCAAVALLVVTAVYVALALYAWLGRV